MQPPIIRDDGPQPVRGFYQRVEKNRPRDLSIVKRLAGRDERKPILSEREPYGDYSDSRSFQNQTSSQQDAIKSYFDGPMFQEWLSLARKHRSTQETSG
jgi:hypothetical protein